MSDQSAGGDQHAASSPTAASAAPAAQSQQHAAPEPNPRSQGWSPAQQARQQQQPETIEARIKLGDVEYAESGVRSAIAHQAETNARKAALPAAPNDYQVRLPADFRAPEGVRFEFDANDPALARARDLAHKRGIDQDTFSDMLGVYAATKVAEQQRTASLIAANREKLGSAADNRINALDTWLKARVGDKARPMIAALKAYPVVETVEALEGLMRQFSNQGVADYSQSHRQEADNSGKIPGYNNMSYAQKRAAQDALRPTQPPRASGGK